MSQEIAVIVKDGQNVVSTNTVIEGSGATGRPLIVKAGSKQSIELKNVATGVAPDQVHVTKDGKNLKIKLGKKASVQDDSADIIIEDYYANDASLIGVAENGQYYNFIPQGTNPDSSYYSLGGDVIGQATETDWLPIALALLGAGALAALAGGGGGGDRTAPDSLTVALEDDEAPITGAITAGTVTNDTTPVISGQTEANATVTAKDDAGNTLGSATADGNGNYSIIPTTPLSEGQHYISVTAADAAGNDIAVSSVIFTVDTTAPDAPVLNPTDGSPITGTAEAGSTITITDGNGNPIGTTTANQNGNFSYTPATPIPNGTVINATATDAAGNESGPGTTTVNSTILEAPIVYDDVEPVIGLVFNNETTNDARPTFSGSLAVSDAGSTIEVFDGATSLGTTTVQSDGSWSLTPGSNLAEGAHNITYTKGGSTSPATNFTVDTISPTATTNITAIDTDTGILGDFMTSDTTLIISGTNTTMNAGEKVQLSLDGGITWVNATQNDATHWSYDNSANAMTVGGHTLQSRVIDAAGNTGAVDTQNITIEPPAVIDLGDDGQLIHPVFVDGNWYYYWDKDKDGEGEINGASDLDDWFTHDQLDAIFMYDVNGNLRPDNSPDTTDTYRYTTLEGYDVALPTYGAVTYGVQAGTVIDNNPAGEINPTYDDLVAIWDAFNGNGETTTTVPGVPDGWSQGIYWSATQYDINKHYTMDLTNGLGGTNGEHDTYWVAVQVIF
jgi:hypothetical protein